MLYEYFSIVIVNVSSIIRCGYKMDHMRLGSQYIVGLHEKFNTNSVSKNVMKVLQTWR